MPPSSADAPRVPEADYFPDLSYHYGLSFHELASMPHWALRLYARALPRLVAEETLREIGVTSFPHMKRQTQRAVERGLKRRLRQTTATRMPRAKYDEALGGMGIRVVR